MHEHEHTRTHEARTVLRMRFSSSVSRKRSATSSWNTFFSAIHAFCLCEFKRQLGVEWPTHFGSGSQMKFAPDPVQVCIFKDILGLVLTPLRQNPNDRLSVSPTSLLHGYLQCPCYTARIACICSCVRVHTVLSRSWFFQLKYLSVRVTCKHATRVFAYALTHIHARARTRTRTRTHAHSI